MEGDNLKLLIAAFITLLVGVSLLTVIAGEGNAVREKINIGNESLNITSFRNESESDCNITMIPVPISNAPSGWQTESSYGCWITDFTMDFSNGTDLTNGTDFVFYANNGTWKCLLSSGINWTTTTNMTAMNYTYCPDTYLTQSWARTMVGTVPGFFSLALIAVSIGLFYTILRREGLINI